MKTGHWLSQSKNNVVSSCDLFAFWCLQMWVEVRFWLFFFHLSDVTHFGLCSAQARFKTHIIFFLWQHITYQVNRQPFCSGYEEIEMNGLLESFEKLENKIPLVLDMRPALSKFLYFQSDIFDVADIGASVCLPMLECCCGREAVAAVHGATNADWFELCWDWKWNGKYHRRLFLGCALKFQFPSGNQILEPIAKCTTLVFKFEQHKNARHNSLLILLIILFFDDFCIASRWFQKTVLVTILGFQPREGMTAPMPCQLQLLFWFSILVSHVGNCSSDTFFWFAVQPYNAVGEMIFCHSHHRHRCSSFAGKFAIEQFRFSECPRILSQNVCVATEFKLRWWHWFFTIHYTHLNFPRNYILLISNDQFVPRDFSLSRGMRCKNSCCRDACVASNCLSFCIAATGAFQCLANLINAFSNRFSNSCVDMWYPSTIVADVQFTLRTAYRLGKNYIQFF